MSKPPKSSTGNEDPSQVSPWKAKKIPRTQNKATISVIPEEQPIWKQYVEICDRDGHSASEEIMKFVKQQVAARVPGNPQRPITYYATPQEKPKKKNLWRPGWNTVIVNGKFKEVWIAEE